VDQALDHAAQRCGLQRTPHNLLIEQTLQSGVATGWQPEDRVLTLFFY
jgi:hypothetical protein